jgi:hypothetical protein
MAEPRALTAEEMRAAMFEHMAAMLAYWRDVELHMKPAEQSEIQYRMEGFLFSLLVMFDGGSADLPAMAITPMPHPEDEAYCRDQGENWWSEEEINDTQMHEVFPWKKCR